MRQARLAIGLIFSHGFAVPVPFFESYVRFQQALLTREFNGGAFGVEVDAVNLTFSHAFPTDVARNELVRIFLDKNRGYDHLLFLDADMTHPPDIAHRLLRHGVDVVTGRYTLRKAPYFSVAMRKTGDGPRDYQAVEKLVPLAEVKGLVEIDAAGAGALLLSRRVLDAVRERCGDVWFQYQVGPSGLRDVSEDMWFFEQARACGFQPYLDADVWCGHEMRTIVDPSWHVPYADAFLRATAEPVNAG